jgi:hypothetical protein
LTSLKRRAQISIRLCLFLSITVRIASQYLKAFADSLTGEYQDRRHLTKVDCSKTIWILATNALDTTIQNFCKLHDKPIFVDDDHGEKLRLMKQLSKELKEDFLSKFSVSFTQVPNMEAYLTVQTVPHHRSNLRIPPIPSILAG